MRKFAVAGVQMAIGHAVDNTPAMARHLDALVARFPWIEMVVFSELAPFGYSLPFAQTLPGPAETAFCAMAARHGVWLIPGSMLERCGERVYNTASVIDPTGHVVTRYRKMFPFRPYEQGVDGGDQFCVFDVPKVGRFGVSICYDMWFPETIRTLATMGAEAILHPTATDTIDRNVELAIARASAATNQLFFFDVNGVGPIGNGRSCFVRPTGTVVYEAGGNEEIIPIDFDLSVARQCREKGMFGLGQVLKSFRDREVHFSIYDKEVADRSYLDELGPLVVPGRRVRSAP